MVKRGHHCSGSPCIVWYLQSTYKFHAHSQLSILYSIEFLWYILSIYSNIRFALSLSQKKAKYMVPFMLYKLVLIFIFTMILGFAPAMVDEIKKHFEHIREDNVLPCIILTSLFFLGNYHRNAISPLVSLDTQPAII